MPAWPKMPNSPREIVMMVDDDADELGMLGAAMEHAGFGTLAPASDNAALELLGHATPDLIVLDALMPGLDGFETCRRIKADTRLAHLPVIFMTGLKAPEDIVRGLESGGVDYVTKPVNIVELLARAHIHIANSRVAFGARVALDATGRYLLATDGRGQVRWSTPQAASLLADAFAAADVTLPDAVAVLVRHLIQAGETGKPQPVAGSEMTIAFLGRNGAADEYLFRLTAASAGGEEGILQGEFALTTREAEVLLWLAKGKANKEISDILLISPRTVNKHLERVFAKLGVENRASAASLAMRTLAARA